MRLLSTILATILAASPVVVRATGQQPTEPGQSATQDKASDADVPGSLSTEDLITKLQEESNQGMGTHTTAVASGFLAINDEPRFTMGILGSQKPVASPVMRELVRRGVAALPLLISHLSDSRSTKLTVGDGFMGKWFTDEYEPRFSDPAKKPSGVNTKIERRFERYTLRVGDFCFVAIGQIVNRRLNAVRYQPSLCLVVNSPKEFPALAAAVKTDWAGLTPEEHEASLKQDIINRSLHLDPVEGLKRLSFYYPDAGYPLIVKMLNRPFFDRSLVREFFCDTLMAVTGDDADARLMKEFRVKHGETNYAGVLGCLLCVSNFPESQMSPERVLQKKKADNLLKGFFPEVVDPCNPPFLNAVELADQETLIEGLAAVHSKAVDDSVLIVLERTVSLPVAKNRDDRHYQYSLAVTCVRHLTGQKEYHAACRTTLQTLVSKFEEAKESKGDSKAIREHVVLLRKFLNSL